MNKPLAIALLVAGMVLIIFGLNSNQSVSSGVSRFFTGSPTNKTLWLLIGGIVAAIVGFVGLARGSK
ncbi:Membrane protein [Verrucomicrobia bacterium]|nr:Membrane protein [Verrucomicrobiota bacterium]